MIKIKKLLQYKFSPLIIILLLSLPACIPLLHSGFFHFSDEPHLINLQQMITAFASGQILPRWAPDMSWGYGYPLFNYYYPLPYYIGSLFYLLNHSLISSLKLVFLLTIPLSGIFMYLWLKEHTSKLGAGVGALIYIYTPYRALDLYIRGAVGECLAFVFIPLIAYLIDKYISGKSLKYLGILAISLGLFFTSHNLAPLIFVPWLLIYALLRIYLNKDYRLLPYLLGSFILGFLVSAFWTVPAFIERGLLQYSTPFNYIDHFPFIKQLIYSPWRYGASLPGPYDDLSFQIGFINLFIIIYAIYLLLKGAVVQNKRYFLIFILCTMFFVLFLMNIRSDFLWRIFPLSNYVQFPWRFLMVTTFLTAALTMIINNKRLLIIMGILSIVMNYNYFKPSGYFYPDDKYYLKRMLPYYEVNGQEINSDEYFNYSEDYLLLPKWVTVRPNSLPDSKFYSTSAEDLDVKENTKVNFTLETNEATEIIFNTYYFPGWQVTVNNKKMDLNLLKPYGNFALRVEANSTLKYFWKETQLRLAMDLLSLAAFIFSLILVVGKDKWFYVFKR